MGIVQQVQRKLRYSSMRLQNQCLRAGEEAARLSEEADSMLRGAGVPVLVLLGGEDAVGAREWPAAEETAGVDVKTYPAGRHHLFHDAVREEVIADLSAWLKA